MTEKPVESIIAEIIEDHGQKNVLADLEKSLASLTQSLQNELTGSILEMLEKELHRRRPQGWKNLGTAKRSLLTELGEIQYKRHIYRDEQGRRQMPLDQLLQIDRYARNSRNLDAMGASLAAESRYRKAAETLSYRLKQDVSPSTISRMVGRVGKKIQSWEAQEQYSEAPPGKISAPVLYCESDGVYIHLQREKQKKAEVKVGICYTGKKMIGKKRFRCKDKVTTCQLGLSNLERQVHLRELVYRHYDCFRVRLAVIGGDGAAWVQNSFDLLGLPEIHLLDRFHVLRSLRRSFASVPDISELSKELFSQGFSAIAPQLRKNMAEQETALHKRQLETYHYLRTHANSLVSLDQRGFAFSFSTLGSMEGNVDKLVRQRMRGRGMAWSVSGAQSLLAVMRHKQLIKSRALAYLPAGKPGSRPSAGRSKGTVPKWSAPTYSIPAFSSAESSDDWVQLLKHLIDDSLFINAFF